MAYAGVGRRRVPRFLAVATVVAATVFLMVGPPQSGRALAAPGSPGTPQAPGQLFSETFESNPVGTPVLLTNYVGSGGMRYTADPPWLQACNGNVVAFFMTALPPNCSAGPQGMDNLRSLAYALGVLQGQADPTTNRALSAYTDLGNNTAVDPGAGLVQIQTLNPITIPPNAGKRYVTFSVDVAAVTCQFSHPLLQFSLLSDGTVIPVAGQIDACTDPRGRDVVVPFPEPPGTTTVHIGRYAAPGSIATTGTTLGIRMVNNQGSGLGNDAAVDDLQLLDATPQLDKSFSPAVQVAGQPVQLTYTITNTAELASKLGWSFTDALPPGLTVVSPSATTTCTNGVVSAPAGSTSVTVTGDLQTNQPSCTVTVNVTAAAGHFVNGPGNVTPDGVLLPGTSTVDFEPVLTLHKVGIPEDTNGNGRIDAGEPIQYSFTVTNPLSNGVTLSNIAVADPRVGPVSCPVTTLAAGASTVCTATYTVTQADEDAGAVNNTATVTATSPDGVPNPAPVSSSASTPLESAPSITLVKSVDPTSVSAVDETVTYTFTATNTGNVTLTGVVVNETEFTGTGTRPVIICPTTTLAPSASVVCTASYTVTQVDVNAGFVSDTATATGTPPIGSPVTSPPASAVVTIPASAALILVKSVDPTSVGRAGDTVTYSFLVTNSGNVELTGVVVDETAFSGTGTRPVVTCPTTTLTPGQSTTCTGTYTVTQADANAGSVTNTATATGTSPAGTPVTSPPSSAALTIPPARAITLVKSVAPMTVNAVGDMVTYSFDVTNAGNVTLTGVVIDESAFSGTGTRPVVTCPTTSLTPGQSTICTATYSVTQADLDAGSVTNTATATGTPPSGPAVISDPSSAAVSVAAVTELALQKTAGPPVDANGTGRVDAGDTIAYTFVVTNNGNVTLTDVNVSDEKVGPVTCPTTPLPPGDSVTCTVTYTITQADVDAGTVANTATATATAPDGAPQPNHPTDSTSTPIPAVPAIQLTKTADKTGLTAGETILYTFTAVNTGNVTLTNVTITDIDFSGTGTLSPLACNRTVSTTVAPGLTLTCRATYTVTQADVDAGTLNNEGMATGTPPSGPDVTSTASLAIPQPNQPAITLHKRATVTDTNHDGVTDAGDEILYLYDVTNAGNVTLTAVTIHDEALTAAGIAITCPGTALSPGQTTTCQAARPRVVTAADVAAGAITNTATATATTPGEELVVSAPQTLTITVSRPPSPGLPVTGLPLPAFGAAAMLLIGSGATVLSVGRIKRRRRR